MGETFLDSWQEELPEQLVCKLSPEQSVVFKFDHQNNSKWEGNFYVYQRYVFQKPEDPDPELHRITIRSLDDDRKHLYATIHLRKPGFEIQISHRSGNFEKRGSPEERWVPALRFDSLEAVIASSLEKYQELLPIFNQLSAGQDWEGED